MAERYPSPSKRNGCQMPESLVTDLFHLSVHMISHVTTTKWHRQHDSPIVANDQLAAEPFSVRTDISKNP